MRIEKNAPSENSPRTLWKGQGNVLKALQVVMMARIDSCAPSFFRLVLDRKKRIMESEKAVAFNSNPRGVVVRVKCWKAK